MQFSVHPVAVPRTGHDAEAFSSSIVGESGEQLTILDPNPQFPTTSGLIHLPKYYFPYAMLKEFVNYRCDLPL